MAGELRGLSPSDEIPTDYTQLTNSQSSREGSADKRPSILVVDDHFTIADTLADILNGAGFEAVVAYEARAALQIAEKLRPQCLLTDVVMPVMNGVELAIAIRQMLPATKILLLSGQAGISDILHHGRQQGYEFELIAKPIHPEKLLDQLKKTIDL
jgi:CheY-like chemotaxis protein